MDNQPKITDVEAFLLVSAALIIDIVPAVLISLGLPDFFIPGLISFSFQAYFRSKEIPARLDLIASMVELVPYVSALPVKTVCVFIIIWADRHPESSAARIVEKAAAVTVKREKGGAFPVQNAEARPAGMKTPVGGLQPKPALTKTEFNQAA